ncbi:DUF4190 domain-containing protein [Sandaracinus amylolyticus]|uniref:DUF4190 domain-containing protein n=1 Tax=Sandaracinus amylolyticus TaxID=927083 RepID=A0A0F6W7Z5_9BACT|nr:DUF4190 domain-containing protein [Sandaracinus amylolyticus]AKF09633.1 hypothetical protein DB32_006782 [Sandaracinus amylolyticus]
MGLGSILLGVFALIFMFGGFVLTFVPFLGTMLSFLAPVLAVAGIVLGGVALSRARENRQNEGLAIAGLVVNIVAFVPAMLVAVTCGLCNTVCTGIALTPSDPNATPWYQRDAGPSPFDVLFVDAGVPHATPNAPNTPPPIAPPPIAPPSPIEPLPSAPPGAPAQPPGTLPPPPLPPGPVAPAPETSAR